MPSTGTPSSSIFGSQTGASLSYTELGPPESTIPTGSCARISAIVAVHGRIAEKTSCSRMRRAMSCVYCPPKSRTTIPFLTITSLLLLHHDCTASRFQDNIDQALGHDDYFRRRLAGHQRRDVRVGHHALPQFFFA